MTTAPNSQPTLPPSLAVSYARRATESRLFWIERSRIINRHERGLTATLTEDAFSSFAATNGVSI